MPHKITSVKNFNEMVAVDCFMLADSDGVQKLFLNAVDVASSFQIVAVLKSRHPQTVYQKFAQMWLVPFGTPKKDFACSVRRQSARTKEAKLASEDQIGNRIRTVMFELQTSIEIFFGH